jgi:hypothetical protein
MCTSLNSCVAEQRLGVAGLLQSGSSGAVFAQADRVHTEDPQPLDQAVILEHDRLSRREAGSIHNSGNIHVKTFNCDSRGTRRSDNSRGVLCKSAQFARIGGTDRVTEVGCSELNSQSDEENHSGATDGAYQVRDPKAILC